MKKLKIEWNEDLEEMEEWEEHLPPDFDEKKAREWNPDWEKDLAREFNTRGLQGEIKRALCIEEDRVGYKNISQRKLWLAIRNRLVRVQVEKLCNLFNRSFAKHSVPFLIQREGAFNRDIFALRSLEGGVPYRGTDDEQFQSFRHFEVTVRKELETLSNEKLVEFFFKEFRL